MEQRAQKETQINIYSQVIFDKETKATNAAETASSTNGARTAGHTHTLMRAQTLHLSQKLTQNGS